MATASWARDRTPDTAPRSRRTTPSEPASRRTMTGGQPAWSSGFFFSQQSLRHRVLICAVQPFPHPGQLGRGNDRQDQQHHRGQSQRCRQDGDWVDKTIPGLLSCLPLWCSELPGFTHVACTGVVPPAPFIWRAQRLQYTPTSGINDRELSYGALGDKAVSNQP